MDFPTIPIFSRRILIVDDNLLDRHSIARTLEIEGYIVHQAKDSRGALDILQRASPELILSAINLPGSSGIEFYQALRKNPRWLAIPFICLTNHDSADLIQAGHDLGIEDYLAKPIESQTLVKTVNARLLRAAEVQIAYMDQAYLETVNMLANTVEGRDPLTHGHVERVATYARWLAEELHWSDEHLRTLDFGSRLHDIGKIVIPDHILKKPEALTVDEWKLMKTHTVEGAKIMQNISHLRSIIPYVLFHHERWDGSGYPEGLRGRHIPLEGRLLAIVDVYDALTTARPYHPARPHKEVIKYLRLRSTTLFDPNLVEIFIQVLEKRAQPI